MLVPPVVSALAQQLFSPSRRSDPALCLLALICAATAQSALHTQYLSRNSGFSDSRRGVLLAARTLFRDESAGVRDRKVRAIEAGFSAAGIA